MAWANGQIPSSELRPCDGTPGAVLLPAQAASWNAVRAEVGRRFGWYPTITSAGDAYRSYSRQVTLFTRNFSTKNTGVDRRTWDGRTWWRVPGYPSAATPGTSNHGKGVTVDVTGLGAFDSTRHRQFSQVAKAHGWSDSEGRKIAEPWHWNGHSAVTLASNPGSNVGGISLPDIITAPIPGIEEDDMPYSEQDLKRITAETLAENLPRLLGEAVPRLVAETMRSSIGDGGPGGVGAEWWVRSSDKRWAESARKNVGDIAAANPNSWWAVGMRSLMSGARVDEAALAQSVTSALVPAVVSALADETDLTEAQVEAATERVLRRVLGGLG